MEHRYYPRLNTTLDVAAFQGPRFLGYFRTRDLSLDGLFLKTGKIDLGRNDIIRLRLLVNGEKLWMRGMVVHTSQRGVGLILEQSDPDAFYTLFTILKGLHSPSRPTLAEGARAQLKKPAQSTRHQANGGRYARAV